MALIDEDRRRGLMDQIPMDSGRAPAADGSQSNPMNTELGRNITNTLSALPGVAAVPGVAAAAGGLAARALGASAPAVTAVGRMAQTAAPYAPVAGGAAALHSAAGASSPAAPAVPASAPTGPDVAVPTSPSVLPPAQIAAPRPQGIADAAGVTPGSAATGNVTRVGNSYSGTNIGGDITINGQAPRNGGQVSAQSMAAADSLAARALSQTPAAQQAPTSLAQAAGINAPTVLHSGNSWQARNDLRNLEVAASSITNQPGFRDTTQAWSTRRNQAGGPTAATQAYQTALAADIAARGAQPGYDMAAARENAATQREGMQQAGATARAALSSGIDQQRLALEQERDSIANRAARQLETQRAIAVDPRSTPEQRSAAERALLTLQGKQQQADPYLVVPGGQQIDPGSGRAYNTPSSVFNRQTGQWLQQPGQSGAQASQFNVGQVYVDGQGRRAKFNGTGWDPA